MPQEGGRDGKKPKHQMVRKEQAIATTLCDELQASNWVYNEVPQLEALGFPWYSWGNC